MKIESPPVIATIERKEVIDDYITKKYGQFLQITDDRYFYWDEIKHRKQLPYKDPVSVWALVKFHRRVNYRTIEFGQYKFNFCLTESIQKNLHEFDLKLVGGLYKSPITQFEKSEYLKNSLMEEAIASSQVEGAATTTQVAFEMLKSQRNPRNESEQMIFNNLRAIQFISEELDKTLSFEFIIEIHRIMTANTSAEYCAGSFRDKPTFVLDHVDGEIAHTPPPADELNKLMSDLCEFANSNTQFIHPIIKASIIHFMFGYIHPFIDGNGRTARALFYWYLMKQDYSLIKNISISRVILDSRIQYDKAFLRTENDENDMTYFINYSIKSLRVAFESLIKYRDKKKHEREQSNLISYKLLEKGLNKRQSDFVGYLYTRENKSVKLQQYAKKHGVVRQTARNDVNQLVTLGLIQESKEGRDIVFRLSDKKRIDTFLNQ